MKIPFLKLLNKIKPIICFICAFDQSDSKLSVKKIWGTASFFSNLGPAVQATLRVDD